MMDREEIDGIIHEAERDVQLGVLLDNVNRILREVLGLRNFLYAYMKQEAQKGVERG